MDIYDNLSNLNLFVNQLTEKSMFIEELKSTTIIEELNSANITNTQLHVRLTPTKLIRMSDVLLCIKETNKQIEDVSGLFQTVSRSPYINPES